jgi:hypothetical protein
MEDDLKPSVMVVDNNNKTTTATTHRVLGLTNSISDGDDLQ